MRVAIHSCSIVGCWLLCMSIPFWYACYFLSTKFWDACCSTWVFHFRKLVTVHEYCILGCLYFTWVLHCRMGTAVAEWLTMVTNRKVAGSIPDDVIGIFHWHPSDRTMDLGSTQLLTEMSTRSISWGKGGRCVRLTTLPPSCAVFV